MRRGGKGERWIKKGRKILRGESLQVVFSIVTFFNRTFMKLKLFYRPVTNRVGKHDYIKKHRIQVIFPLIFFPLLIIERNFAFICRQLVTMINTIVRQKTKKDTRKRKKGISYISLPITFSLLLTIERLRAKFVRYRYQSRINTDG